MRVRDAIPAGALVAIDTAPFIYYIEGGSTVDQAVAELFEDCIAIGRNQAVTTVITLAEVLVGAFQAGRQDLVERYRAVLSRSTGLRMLTLSTEAAERAADIRARHRLRLPDALQIAAAIDARGLPDHQRHRFQAGWRDRCGGPLRLDKLIAARVALARVLTLMDISAPERM